MCIHHNQNITMTNDEVAEQCEMSEFDKQFTTSDYTAIPQKVRDACFALTTGDPDQFARFKDIVGWKRTCDATMARAAAEWLRKAELADGASRVIVCTYIEALNAECGDDNAKRAPILYVCRILMRRSAYLHNCRRITRGRIAKSAAHADLSANADYSQFKLAMYELSDQELGELRVVLRTHKRRFERITDELDQFARKRQSVSGEPMYILRHFIGGCDEQAATLAMRALVQVREKRDDLLAKIDEL